MAVGSLFCYALYLPQNKLLEEWRLVQIAIKLPIISHFFVFLYFCLMYSVDGLITNYKFVFDGF
ncbi:MAG TPA: hypothetical protein DE044_14755 [Alteromonas macleodii]|nr:hypothetical protein [Alteromonas macleodii]